MVESEREEASTLNMHVQCLSSCYLPSHLPDRSLDSVSQSRRYPYYAISLTACDDPFLARTTDYLILVMSFQHTDFITCLAQFTPCSEDALPYLTVSSKFSYTTFRSRSSLSSISFSDVGYSSPSHLMGRTPL